MMNRIAIFQNPQPDTWPALAERNAPDDAAVEQSVRHIIAEVRAHGDEALRRFALAFDHAHIDALALSDDERQRMEQGVSNDVKRAIDRAMHHIEAFHAAQRPHTVDVYTQQGVHCIQKAVPLQRVGLYIPGGRAPLFSTVLMLALPARIAGCKEVVLCTPQGANGFIAPEIIYAANRCGVHTAIDMPAGPSEVLVMADNTARPDFIAADMLSQAEHGPDSQAMLVCQSSALAEAVATEVERQTALLPRAALVEQSLSKSRIIVLPTRQAMTDFANAYAAEHLIVQMERPWEIAERITAAGSVFVGHYSPESAGDYASGTNHTLPTSGWAAAYSGVNLDSYFHKITFQELSSEGLASLAPTITTMARAEGLEAHARAVEVRTRR